MFNKKYSLTLLRFQCCGVVSFQSNEPWKYWQQCNWWKNQELRKENKVPDSCCRTQTPDCGKRDHPSNIYRSGKKYTSDSI